MFRFGGARASGRGLSTPSVFPSPPPIKPLRGKASTTSTPPPVTSSSAPRLETETTAAWLKVLGPTIFVLSSDLARASVMVEAATPLVASSPTQTVEPEAIVTQLEVPSSIVEAMMPLVASPIGSPARPSLSLGAFLCTFAEEGDVEAADEASSAETSAPKAPAQTVPKVEQEMEPRLEVPSSGW
ncbi:hypothetical protein AMTR_s00035p00161960 [Amborella trichopoda]|uniref:Uncharacterized protein n=1 Tax=Amborella trichopoda TaxID=13333 RepID=W1PW43_AMBTC|nr:hypothetical protein AMTR_s00035p00161960 [Amborella trichopoda]